MREKNQSLKCSHQVRSIQLERYRLPSDGRKWRQAARGRCELLVRLSTYANGDGTFVRDGKNYSPSWKTLTKHVAEKSLDRRMDALRDLGLLSWTRDQHHARRVYQIHLSDSQVTPVTFESEHLSNSPITPVTLGAKDENHLSYSPKSPVTMGGIPSLPPKEREPSLPSSPQAASENHLSLADSEKAKASHDVNPDDVDAIGAAFCRLMDQYGGKYKDPKDGVSSGFAKPVARADIEKLLRRRFSRAEIIEELQWAFENAADDAAIKYMEKRFFADQGGAAMIVRRRQDDWRANIQRYIDAKELTEEPDNLDNFIKTEPIPAGLEIEGCDLINKARKNWDRCVQKHFSRTKNCPTCGSPNIFHDQNRWKCKNCTSTADASVEAAEITAEFLN